MRSPITDTGAPSPTVELWRGASSSRRPAMRSGPSFVRRAIKPWFWGTHAGAELDLLVDVDSKRIGLEVKRSDQPRVTPSMRHALVDLELDQLIVVHAGDRAFPLAEDVNGILAKQLLIDGLIVE